MLILSNAALRYAVNVCDEKRTSVVIGALDDVWCKRISEQIDLIIRWMGLGESIQINTAHLPYATYRYKNGSKINIVPAETTARGYRCNTLILQREILDTPEYSDIFLAMELFGRGEMY